MNLSRPQYLGDGVYVEIENGMLLLTTEDRRNRVYLEAEVYACLVRYVANVEKAKAEQEKRAPPPRVPGEGT